mmetsp:Transcript_39165/g.65800  ORF Transcript_39165/g.65800 Transcript_39165/m.65800 type:complete len:209 (+) Transcript_39165:1040-1666(+)
MLHHRAPERIRDSHPSAACTTHDEFFVDNGFGPLSSDSQSAVHRSHAGSSRALNVVVENAEVVAVALQQHLCVLGLEVLKLDDRFGPAQLDRIHELVHQLHVPLALHPPALQAEVAVAPEQPLVVGAHVDHAGERARGVEPSPGHIEVHLPHDDAHAVQAEVAQAEHAAAVCHHDHLHLLDRPVVHHRGHLPAVHRGEEHSSRPAENG